MLRKSAMFLLLLLLLLLLLFFCCCCQGLSPSSTPTCELSENRRLAWRKS